MLNVDMNARITAEDAINHMWIKKKVNDDANSDPLATIAALNNLRNFRVRYLIYINNFIG